jgi:hypothetical protein
MINSKFDCSFDTTSEFHNLNQLISECHQVESLKFDCKMTGKTALYESTVVDTIKSFAVKLKEIIVKFFKTMSNKIKLILDKIRGKKPQSSTDGKPDETNTDNKEDKTEPSAIPENVKKDLDELTAKIDDAKKKANEADIRKKEASKTNNTVEVEKAAAEVKEAEIEYNNATEKQKHIYAKYGGKKAKFGYHPKDTSDKILPVRSEKIKMYETFNRGEGFNTLYNISGSMIRSISGSAKDGSRLTMKMKMEEDDYSSKEQLISDTTSKHAKTIDEFKQYIHDICFGKEVESDVSRKVLDGAQYFIDNYDKIVQNNSKIESDLLTAVDGFNKFANENGHLEHMAKYKTLMSIEINTSLQLIQIVNSTGLTGLACANRIINAKF